MQEHLGGVQSRAASRRVLREHSLVHADIVIRPAIGRRPWFDFSLPSGGLDFVAVIRQRRAAQ